MCMKDNYAVPSQDDFDKWSNIEVIRLPLFVEKGLKDIFENKENQLTPEMQKIMLDNLSDLYEE